MTTRARRMFPCLLLAVACAESAAGPHALVAPPRWAGIREDWPSSPPPCALLVIDGVPTAQRVVAGRCAFPAELVVRADNLVSLTFLRPAEARAAYGPAAAAGAAVIVTRRASAGRRAGPS